MNNTVTNIEIKMNTEVIQNNFWLKISACTGCGVDALDVKFAVQFSWQLVDEFFSHVSLND
jgi:hypothetical protein